MACYLYLYNSEPIHQAQYRDKRRVPPSGSFLHYLTTYTLVVFSGTLLGQFQLRENRIMFIATVCRFEQTRWWKYARRRDGHESAA